MVSYPLTDEPVTHDERRYVAWILSEWGDDVARIAEATGQTPHRCAVAWGRRSTDWCAQWLNLPTDDDDLLKDIAPYWPCRRCEP